jgi:hypothetical protein
MLDHQGIEERRVGVTGTESRRSWHWSWSAVCFAAATTVLVLFYFSTASRLVVSFPFWDDYNATLEPILKMQAAGGPTEKVGIAFAQHNEHRIVFAKLLQFALFNIERRIDFRC